MYNIFLIFCLILSQKTAHFFSFENYKLAYPFNVTETCKCLSYGALNSKCLDESSKKPENLTNTPCLKFLRKLYSPNANELDPIDAPIECPSYKGGAEWLNQKCYSRILQQFSRQGKGWFDVRDTQKLLSCSDNEKNKIISLQPNGDNWRFSNLDEKNISHEESFMLMGHKRLELYYNLDLFNHIHRMKGYPFVFSIVLVPGEKGRQIGKSLRGDYSYCYEKWTSGKLDNFKECHHLVLHIFFYIGYDGRTDNYGIRLYTWALSDKHKFNRLRGFAKNDTQLYSAIRIQKASMSELEKTGKIMDIFIPRNYSKSITFYSSQGLYHVSRLLDKHMVHPASLARPNYNFQPVPTAPEHFTLVYNRLYPNGMFELELGWSWPKHWYGSAARYRIDCKAFDIRDRHYYDASCNLCLDDPGKAMAMCWGCLSSNCTIAHQPSSFFTDSASQFSKVIILKANMGDLAWPNGTLHWNPKPTKGTDYSDKFYNIVKFNALRYILWPQDNSVWISDLKQWIREKPQKLEFIRENLVMPSSNDVITELGKLNYASTYLICALRGQLVDGTLGDYSKPIKIKISLPSSTKQEILANSASWGQIWRIQYQQAILRFEKTVQTALTMPSLFGMSDDGPVSIEDEFRWIDDGDQRKRVPRRTGCFHWMFNQWYSFFTITTGETFLGMHSVRTTGLKFSKLPWKKVLKIPADHLLGEAVCMPLHSAIAWTFTNEISGYVSIHLLRLDSNTGKAGGQPSLIGSAILCACSPSNTSDMDPNLLAVQYTAHHLRMPEIIVKCGSTICAYNMELKLSITIATLVPTVLIKAMTVDNGFLYFFVDNTTEGGFQGFGILDYLVILKINKSYPTYVNIWRVQGQLGLSWLETNSTDIQLVSHLYERATNARSNPNGASSFEEDSEMFIAGLQPYTTARKLPVPPYSCIFPKINTTSLNMAMTSAKMLSVKVDVSWTKNSKCSFVAKPPSILLIKYAQIGNNSLPDKHRSCSLNLHCAVVKTAADLSQRKRFELGPLESNKHYYFELFALPGFKNETLLLWSNSRKQRPISMIFETNYTPPMQKAVIQPVHLVGIIVIIVLLLATTLLAALCYYNKKYYLYQSLQRILVDDVHREEKLGEGHFGEVWKATWKKNKVIVLKLLKESATAQEEKEFREEALLLSKLRSDYIIRPIGICLQSRPIMLALEFMNGGSVESYLRRSDVRDSIEVSDLFHIAIQASKGCVYLQNEGYIHRDIAARNCLVSLISSTNIKPARELHTN